ECGKRWVGFDQFDHDEPRHDRRNASCRRRFRLRMPHDRLEASHAARALVAGAGRFAPSPSSPPKKIFANGAALRHQPFVRTPRSEAPPSVTWFDLDDHAGVLDVERLKLSLFVVFPSPGSATSSWWTTEDGTWLMPARVGQA